MSTVAAHDAYNGRQQLALSSRARIWHKVRDSSLQYKISDKDLQVRITVTYNVTAGMLHIIAHNPLGAFNRSYVHEQLQDHAFILAAM